METFLQFDQIIVPKVEHLSMLVRKKKKSLKIDHFSSKFSIISMG